VYPLISLTGPSNIVWRILSDQPDTHWIFIGVYLLVKPDIPIQYYMGDTVGSAWYPLNNSLGGIYWSSLTFIHIIVLDDTVRSGRIPTEYSLGCIQLIKAWPVQVKWFVWDGYCRISRIHYWISLGCIYWLAWHSIQYVYGWYCRISRIPTEYSLGVSIGQPDSPSNIIWMNTVGSARYPLNIYWVYLLVSRQFHPICLDDTVGSAGYPLNIH